MVFLSLFQMESLITPLISFSLTWLNSNDSDTELLKERQLWNEYKTTLMSLIAC